MKRNKNRLSQTPEEAMRTFSSNNNISELARVSGVGKTLLADRYNPDRDQKLGYLEAVGHSHTNDDNTLLDAWASDRGLGTFRLPKASAGDEELLDLMLLSQSKGGEFATDLFKARLDGIIDPDEAAVLLAHLDEHMNKLATIKAELKEQVREVPTALKLANN